MADTPPKLPTPDLGMPWRVNAPDGSVHCAGYTADQMRAYGAECRRQALEDAARVCDVTPPYPFRASIEAAHAIRALKEQQ